MKMAVLPFRVLVRGGDSAEHVALQYPFLIN